VLATGSLAKEFEAAGKRQLAARVYYGLSELPSVEAGGYTNSYDEVDPRRVADRQRAFALNEDDPNLSAWSMEEEVEPDGRARRIDDEEGHRRFIARVAPLWQEHRRVLWPGIGQQLMLNYVWVDDPASACAILQSMHEINVEFHDPKHWSTWQHTVTYDDAEPGPVLQECPIDGVVTSQP